MARADAKSPILRACWAICVCSPSPVSSLVSHVRYVAWLGQLSSRMANMQTLTSRSSIVADQFGEGFLVVQVDTGLQASGAVGRQ